MTAKQARTAAFFQSLLTPYISSLLKAKIGLWPNIDTPPRAYGQNLAHQAFAHYPPTMRPSPSLVRIAIIFGLALSCIAAAWMAGMVVERHARADLAVSIAA